MQRASLDRIRTPLEMRWVVMRRHVYGECFLRDLGTLSEVNKFWSGHPLDRVVLRTDCHAKMEPAFATPSAFPSTSAAPKLRTAPLCSAHGRTTPTAALNRRAALRLGALALAGAALPAHARHSSTMSGDYKADAAKMLADMKVATELTRGAEGVVEKVTQTRSEMNDFVALYRRNDKVSGSTSFNTLYTAINTLSGHYASYGNQYPVPEKRKKRLNQQYAEIARALDRGR